METIPSQKDGVAIPARASVSTLATPEPRRTMQISPGIRRIRTNTSAAAPTSVGTTSSTRFTIYRYILCVRSWSRRRARQRMRTGLLIEPYIGQVLIDVVARADLPSLHIGAQRHDPVPVGYHQLVRLRIEHVLLELAHQRALLRAVGLVQHLLVQIDLRLIVVVPVVLAEHRARQVFLDVEKRVHHAVAAGFDDHVEIAAAHRFVPRT